MAFESYASFLTALERAGELMRLSAPLATELEITELADREMKKPGGGKALLIENQCVRGRVALSAGDQHAGLGASHGHEHGGREHDAVLRNLVR